MSITLFSLTGFAEIQPGDNLAELILQAHRRGETLLPGDVVVVTQKVVSKAEGRLVVLDTVVPSAQAVEFATRWDRDPRQVEVVLQESVRVLRMDFGLIISETRHGFICANAGVDLSNAGSTEIACLLPEDSDASASRIRRKLVAEVGGDLAVVISDTFGRPWRNGIMNVAVGVSGLKPMADYRGRSDPHGYELKATVVAVADEIASAAELVMGKTDRCPVAVLRGYAYEPGEGNIKEVLMDSSRDLFR